MHFFSTTAVKTFSRNTIKIKNLKWQHEHCWSCGGGKETAKLTSTGISYVFLLKAWETYLTIVELTVWLFTVDDVKPVTSASFHSTDFKVKPLMIMIAIYIWVQN